METGDIVISRAGHDEGRAFIVTSVVSDGFVLIADGKTRKIESPKLKRIRHLRVVGKSALKNPTNATLSKRIKKFYSDRRLYAEK
ncbi:MAG: KOW domain-containing RNA-binding protein [Clostridiales bacterium]|nr:KOW domain-containing RNA-binding protein [Clostridiales bacterium]